MQKKSPLQSRLQKLINRQVLMIVEPTVLTAAYCTSLACGHDPNSVVYNQDCLRHHLLRCLENKKMTHFSTIRNRKATFTYVSVKVYIL